MAEGCPSCKVEDGVLYNATGETLYCYPARREGTSFSVPDTVNAIDEYAFSNLSTLAQLDIPEGVTSIGNNAFRDSTSLTRLTVPSSATDIGENLFGTTMDVSGITVRLQAGSAMETYLNSNPSATNSYVSRGIQIEYLSHRDSAGFVLPEDVTVIGEAAFEHIDAVSVNIPDGAASIGDRAFADCLSLEWIWIPESVTDISGTAFAGDTLTIYGVAGSAAETFALGAGIPFVAEG